MSGNADSGQCSECNCSAVMSSSDAAVAIDGDTDMGIISQSTNGRPTFKLANPGRSTITFFVSVLLPHRFSRLAEFQKALAHAAAVVATHIICCCSSDAHSGKPETGEKHGGRLPWPNTLQQPQLGSLQFEGRRACHGGLYVRPGCAPYLVRARDGVFVRRLHASRHA